MRGIDKCYGGVHAVRGVDLDIYTGEVHALVGDNAAGKSTLIKILSGAVMRDGGTISFDSRRGRDRHSHATRRALGIETVYQDLALADNLDVASNVFLGREMTRSGLLRFMLDNGTMERRSRDLLSRLKINMPNIRQRVRSMSGGQRQSIAIARCVCFNARVVILDEPTAALGVEETRKVYALIREMRDQGLAVLMISHNLNHVFENCDRITVLKTGRLVGSRRVDETTQDDILRMIVSGVADDDPTPRPQPRSGGRLNTVLDTRDATRWRSFTPLIFAFARTSLSSFATVCCATRASAATRSRAAIGSTSIRKPEIQRLFLLIEIYVDEAAFELHRNSPHYLRFREDVKDWVVERNWWYWKFLGPADR